MKPTLDDMKLAVARMLPKEILITDFNPNVRPGQSATKFWFKNPGYGPSRITDRDWLHVCWLAEKTLGDLWPVYYARFIEGGSAIINACAETRLEHLCRVRCPEMFTEPQPKP
jgi:hypothetical protein